MPGWSSCPPRAPMRAWISTFRTMTIYEQPGDRFMVMLSAGNLSLSQSIREWLQVETRARSPDAEPLTIGNATSMFNVARVLGATVCRVYHDDGAALQTAGMEFNASMILCGRCSIAWKIPPGRAARSATPCGSRPHAASRCARSPRQVKRSSKGERARVREVMRGSHCHIESQHREPKRCGGWQMPMPIRMRDACPECGSPPGKKNGHIHTDQPHHRCKDCGRQFAATAANRVIDQEHHPLVQPLFRKEHTA
jgi:hypothetical protein